MRPGGLRSKIESCTVLYCMYVCSGVCIASSGFEQGSVRLFCVCGFVCGGCGFVVFCVWWCVYSLCEWLELCVHCTSLLHVSMDAD